MQRKSTIEDKKDKDNKGGISKITIHNYDKQGNNQASPKGSQVR